MAVFTFNLAVPSVGSASKQVTTKILRTEFGDNYDQRAIDGLNSVKETWTLGWNNISNTLAESIITFLAARAGATPFYWTPINETIQKLYICTQWSKTPVINSISSVQATFEQAFDLV